MTLLVLIATLTCAAILAVLATKRRTTYAAMIALVAESGIGIPGKLRFSPACHG
jgi:hypothetical protein